MDLFNITPVNLQIFFLIVVRMGTLFIFVPIFSAQSLPFQIKAAMSVLFAMFLFPVVDKATVAMPTEMLPFFIIMLREFAIGAVLGLTIRFIFTGIASSGVLISRQMALRMAESFDPALQTSSSVIGQYYSMLAMLIFLGVNGHHFIIKAFASSYSLVPLAGGVFSDAFLERFLYLSSGMFLVAIKVAAPVYIALFVLNIVLGVLIRVAPQMHIFTIGFPLKIGVGFIMLSISLPFFTYICQKLFLQLSQDLNILLHALSG